MIEVVVHLVRCSFEASDASQTSVEWPPHPARLFGALVDAADLQNDDHRRILGEFERAEPPLIVTSPWAAAQHPRTNFVVSNEVVKESKYGTIPLRVAPGTRTWPRVMLADPNIRFVWKIDPEPSLVAVLNDICKRIGYFGRSTSPAVVCSQPYTKVDLAGDLAEAHEVWRPVSGMGVPVRSVSPGYLDLLERAFENSMSAHEVPTLEVEYDLRDSPSPSILPNAGYAPIFVVKSFTHSIDSRRVVELTTLARRAFLKQLSMSLPESQQPAALCGHPNLGETNWRQVMFLALTNVGNQHADGSIKGLALVLPLNLERTFRAHALRAWRAVTELTLGSRGLAALTDEPNSAMWALQPKRWSATSATWSTVTPIVPSRFCTSQAQRIRYVQEVCLEAGLPSPEVEIVKSPEQGALCIRADQSKRHKASLGKPNFHATLRFPVKVAGPIVLGDMSHYGLGLCIPDLAAPQ